MKGNQKNLLDASNESKICEFPDYYISSNNITKWGKNSTNIECAHSRSQYFGKNG